MNFNELHPSRFLNAASVEDGDLTLTIDRITMEEFDDRDHPGKKQDKPVIYFRDALQGLVLNKGNAQMIAQMYGPETDHWAGKRIILYKNVEMVMGQMKPVIRVRYVPIDRPAPTPQPAVAPEAAWQMPDTPQAPAAPAPQQQQQLNAYGQAVVGSAAPGSVDAPLPF